MNKHFSVELLLSILVPWTMVAFAPVLVAKTYTAKINDPDGFTNVRSRPDSKAPVVGKLKKDQLFYMETSQTLNDHDINWPAVSDGKNMFGFVHKTRIETVEEVKDVVLVALNSHEQWMADGDLSPIGIFMRTKPFDKGAHKIQRAKEGGVIKIDGKVPYGIDGNLPKVEIATFNIFFGRKKVGLDKKYYADCYEPHLRGEGYGLEPLVSQSGDKIRINMGGSDGAGGYFVTWIVDKDGKVARIVL